MQDLSIFMAKHSLLVSSMLVLIVFIAIIEILRMRRGFNGINPVQATHKINHENATVIDIRSAEAFQAGHILAAHSIPTDPLKQTKKLEKLRKKPVIVVCEQGIKSQKVTSELVKAGYNAVSLTGGMKAWTDANMPIVKE